MRKKVKVIMLPTDKADVKFQLWMNNLDNSLYINPEWITDNTIPQHLYFITDDEIKEEDWYLLGNMHLYQCKIEDTNINNWREGRSKIVATTNTKLWGTTIDAWGNNISQIPIDFIEEYINKQGNIKEVELEYKDIGGEEWQGDDYNGEPFWNKILKLQLNSDRSVIWYLIEDKKMYTRKELKDACAKYYLWKKKGRLNSEEKTSQIWFDKNYPK